MGGLISSLDACEFCSKEKGPLSGCVVVKIDGFVGGVSGCSYQNVGNKCKFRMYFLIGKIPVRMHLLIRTGVLHVERGAATG